MSVHLSSYLVVTEKEMQDHPRLGDDMGDDLQDLLHKVCR